MMFEPRDAPYPELKKSHTMAHTGRPYTDLKPAAAAPVWTAIEGLGRYHILLAALDKPPRKPRGRPRTKG